MQNKTNLCNKPILSGQESDLSIQVKMGLFIRSITKNSDRVLVLLSIIKEEKVIPHLSNSIRISSNFQLLKRLCQVLCRIRIKSTCHHNSANTKVRWRKCQNSATVVTNRRGKKNLRRSPLPKYSEITEACTIHSL